MHSMQPSQSPKNSQCKHLEKLSKIHTSNTSADQSESYKHGQQVGACCIALITLNVVLPALRTSYVLC